MDAIRDGDILYCLLAPGTSMAILALNSLSYLLRIVVVYARSLVSGRPSIHSIALLLCIHILGLIILEEKSLFLYNETAEV